MAKKKVVTTTTVVTETIEDGAKRPFHAMLLIDNSGSMGGWQERVASGVNEYVKSLAATAEKEGFKATVTMALFDSDDRNNLRVDTPRLNVRVGEWVPLETNQIRPHGGTPLYDAVDHALAILDFKHDCDRALVVITDGGENASKKTSSFVKERLDAFQSAGNVVIYLGANQDAWAVGGGMGTHVGTTATYNMNYFGKAIGAATTATMRYASTRDAATASFNATELAGMSGKTEEK